MNDTRWESRKTRAMESQASGNTLKLRARNRFQNHPFCFASDIPVLALPASTAKCAIRLFARVLTFSYTHTGEQSLFRLLLHFMLIIRCKISLGIRSKNPERFDSSAGDEEGEMKHFRATFEIKKTEKGECTCFYFKVWRFRWGNCGVGKFSIHWNVLYFLNILCGNFYRVPNGKMELQFQIFIDSFL